MKDEEYPFEDIRQFIMKRPFLVGKCIDLFEYYPLRCRQLQLTPKRAAYLRSFIEGYLIGKNGL